MLCLNLARPPPPAPTKLVLATPAVGEVTAIWTTLPAADSEPYIYNAAIRLVEKSRSRADITRVDTTNSLNYTFVDLIPFRQYAVDVQTCRPDNVCSEAITETITTLPSGK